MEKFGNPIFINLNEPISGSEILGSIRSKIERPNTFIYHRVCYGNRMQLETSREIFGEIYAPGICPDPISVIIVRIE